MIWLYILFIIPLITATRQSDETSYRSNGLPGNTPIIILQAKSRAYSEFNSGEDRQTSSPPKLKVPGWERKRLVKLLSSLLPTKVQNTPEPYYPIPAYYPSALRQHHGLRQLRKIRDKELTFPQAVKVFWDYWVKRIFSRRSAGSNKDVKPILRMPGLLNGDFLSGFNQDNNPVLPSEDKNDLDTGFNQDNNPVLPSEDKNDLDSGFNQDDNPVLPSEDKNELDSDNSLRTKSKRSKNKKKLREQTQPKWVNDLKAYTKDLTTNYGLEEVHQRLKPVIRSIEKKRHVKVKDVDVDENGEIHISYIDRKKNKKRSARHGNIDDET